MAKKKPTQLDRIETRLKQMEERQLNDVRNLEKRITSRIGHWIDVTAQVVDDHKKVMAALEKPLPSSKQEEPAWVPKLDEYVCIIGGFAAEKLGTGAIRKVVSYDGDNIPWIDGSGSHFGSIACSDGAGSGTVQVNWRNVIRQATETEVAQYQEQIEQAKWPTLKVGDKIVPGPDWGTDELGTFTIGTVTGTNDNFVDIAGTGNEKADGGHYYYRDCHRVQPASAEQIEQQRRREEWAGISELINGDCCEGWTKAEKADIKRICEAGNVPNGIAPEMLSEVIRYSGDEVSSGSWNRLGWPQWTWIPKEEFKRRLEGTIARRKAEEEAKEAAKPLTPGVRVKYDGHEGVLIHPIGKLFCVGVFPDKGYIGGCLDLRRDQFTVLSVQ